VAFVFNCDFAVWFITCTFFLARYSEINQIEFNACVIVNDWISQFETRIAPYLESAEDLSEQECIRLGKKDPEAYPLCRCVLTTASIGFM
jgi:hypothetical protein